jgi:hypothetical protein
VSPTERYRWFVFGEHPDGAVDIADLDGDVLTKVPRALAERLCAAHNQALDLLEEKGIARW